MARVPDKIRILKRQDVFSILMLYLVSTPIGNLKDITYRAVETLKNSELILAEDTRRTSILLNEYSIQAKLESYNDNNKLYKTKKVVELLKSGMEISLVSDNGTPGISDPGFYLVRECVKNSIKACPIPGPCAAIAAISCSGLPTDSFSFYGFLPKKEKKKNDFFENITKRDETIIVYESPHRIKKTIELLAKAMPERNIVIARELTKKFEEFICGSSADVFEKIKNRDIKGEIVLLIGKE
ncbi:MAG: 16S rRNA (cytidine(1402)-2'-O)-methyltransferase [archaeon]